MEVAVGVIRQSFWYPRDGSRIPGAVGIQAAVLSLFVIASTAQAEVLPEDSADEIDQSLIDELDNTVSEELRKDQLKA